MGNREKLRFISVLLTLCFLFSFVVPFTLVNGVEASEEPSVYSAGDLAGKAIDFINDKYQNGEKIDGYTAYVLTLAGEDLASGKWSNNGKTVKQEIQNLADLLGDHNSLIDYITATQNDDGSFGPYANEYGTKAPLQALAMVKDDLAVDTAVYDQVQAAIADAVNYFKTGYRNGSMTYDVNGWNFDYRCVEALSRAGEDLSVGDWVYNGTSLKDAVIASAGATANNPSVKDAVYLAKELTALYAVNPTSSNIDVLANAIIAKQGEDGGFGASIYDHVMVLTALGKTGQIGRIDQNKAFNYINNLKQNHKNSWGFDAGVAWGYASGIEEPDLTAQVVTALSYFDGAGTAGSDVNNLIKDALTYLADIQDPDTAAIPAQWDSTFATAETLIALKSLGKTYNEYAGGESPWVKKSKTKTIAQCLLALSKWNDENRKNRLAGLLISRQKAADPGKGSFENSVYSDMWAYIALGEADKIGELNTGDVKTYILSKQHGDGSWGESFPDAKGNLVYYPDFLSTAQAIRALTYLPGAATDAEIQAAVERGLNYLKGFLQDDGGVYNPWDDPAVDNSEIIITLHKLGRDPKGAEWTKTVDGQNVNPVSYLMNKTMNSDGSFGTSKNVFGATEALNAYVLEIDEQQGAGDNNNNNPTSPPPPASEYIVDIAVVGKDGELLYGPGSVVVSKTGSWGLTAMGALHATGLSYTEAGGFVTSIAGQANSGMSGWMYKVNNSVPSVLACDKTINQGDQIIWWYSTDPNSSGPTWDNLIKNNIILQNQVTMENVIDQANDLQNKIINGSIKPSDAVDEFAKIMSGIKDELASPEISAVDASKTVRHLMENTIASLMENKNATAVQAVAALKSVVTDGVKIVLARPDATGVAQELKNSLTSLVRNIIARVSTIYPWQLELSGSDSTTTVSLPAGILEQQLTQLGQVRRELPDILSGDHLQDVAVLARTPVQQIEMDLAGIAGRKANTELVVAGDVARNLGDSGLKLAVRMNDGFAIVLSGKERAGRIAFIDNKGIKLAARDVGNLLASGLVSGNEPASSAVKGYVLSVSQLDSARGDKLARDAEANSSSHLILRPVGKAYTVAIMDPVDKEVVNSLAEPLELIMNYRGLAENPEITGIYRYQDGKFTFTGAKPGKSGEVISAKTSTGGTFTLLEYDKKFTDLAGHWAEKDIRVLSARHIVSGTTPTTFAPSQMATRAQCAALLVRALGMPKSDAGHAFTDVSDSAWYAGDVAAAAKAGIIKGTSAGMFSPDQGISRAELAVMIGRVLESRTGRKVFDAKKVLAEYTDAGQIPGWAQEGVALAVESGIVNGRTKDTIVPQGMVNRAEIAVIIGRLLEYIE
jgi:hypothetical protein